MTKEKMNEKIDLFDPTVDIENRWNEYNKAIQEVLRHGQFILGPEVEEFEKKIGDFIGVRHAIGVNSGTDALVIALRAAGVKEGDEVITTSFSFFATAESISILGARPVFVDMEEDSFNIDPDKVEEAVTNKTKAVMPVHLFGRPADMEAIQEVAARHDLKVIEDCAQSFGAEWNGNQTGSIGDAGGFSFFPTKNLGGFGDGGMITTDDDEIASIARKLRSHGSEKKYHNEILGYNSRLDTIQAALLLVKLKYVSEANAERIKIAKKYNEALANVEGVKVPEITEGHVFHQYTIRIKSGKRDELRKYLGKRGVGTAVYYPIPQHQLPVYRGEYPVLPITDNLVDEVLSLPIYPELDEANQKEVITAIREGLERL